MDPRNAVQWLGQSENLKPTRVGGSLRRHEKYRGSGAGLEKGVGMFLSDDICVCSCIRQKRGLSRDSYVR